MTRYELLERLAPILSLVNGSAQDVEVLMHSPHFDEDYKVARARQLSTESLDRVRLAADELSRATEALLVSMTRTRDLLPPSPLTCTHEHPIPIVDDNTGDNLGRAGDRCGPGNECGRLACEECQR